MPLSLDFPPERNADVVRQAGVRCLVHTQPRSDPLVAAQLRAIGEVALVDGLAPLPVAGGVRPAPQVPADAVAYLIFTSGSTGRPKGVAITHGNVDAFLDHAGPGLPARPDDVFSQCHGLTFDFSVFEIWSAWSAAATLLAVPRA